MKTLNVSLTVLAGFFLACCSTLSCPQYSTKTWSPEEQHQAAQEVHSLPENSIIVPMLEDYARLRREVR